MKILSIIQSLRLKMSPEMVFLSRCSGGLLFFFEVFVLITPFVLDLDESQIEYVKVCREYSIETFILAFWLVAMVEEKP